MTSRREKQQRCVIFVVKELRIKLSPSGAKYYIDQGLLVCKNVKPNKSLLQNNIISMPFMTVEIVY